MEKAIGILETQKPGEAEAFGILLNHALENNFSFALWRAPNDSVKNLIVSYTAKTLEPKAILEDLAPGFIFAPFDKTKSRHYLPADIMFHFSEGVLNEPANNEANASREWFNEAASKAGLKPSKPFFFKQSSTFSSDKTDYMQLVAKGVQQIEDGAFEKIVPSRAKRVELPESFDAIDTFQKLCDTYPNALISFVSIPNVGTWMGASPELLIQVENNRIFKTVALAGTKPFEPGTDIRNVAWTQKEIEEQALVSRYIISNFKKIRLREYDEQGPKTVIAGNVMHLKTTYAVDMKETNFPQLGSVMLQLIHPTSAVCGMPLEESLAFLKANEGYDREFYAGYLGPVNVSNTISLFVNLRCMQLADTQAILYAGAGVTADSIPESEWDETEIKLNTLLKVIRA
ncbi:MAG: chorismate-binding protein [Cyclobacteriaceae bacterium]|nr:chorismate-binding protein [Cyclobacteriaceae bacterium]